MPRGAHPCEAGEEMNLLYIEVEELRAGEDRLLPLRADTVSPAHGQACNDFWGPGQLCREGRSHTLLNFSAAIFSTSGLAGLHVPWRLAL